VDKKRKILLGALITIILIGSLVMLFYPKTQLNIIIAPSQVNIKIDNGATKRVSNGDKLGISTGSHTVIVSENEFTSYSTTFTIKSGETKDFLVALKPNTDAAQARLNDQTSQDIIQRFNGPILNNATKKLDTQYPILQILPIQARLYSIYPCASQKYPEDTTKVAICVDGTDPQIVPYVEKDLASRGYNVTDYEMIYSFPQDNVDLD
jgi:hypothetical protein